MSNEETSEQECARLRQELANEKAKSARMDGFLAGLEAAATVLEERGKRRRRRKRPRKDWIEKTGDAIFGRMR